MNTRKVKPIRKIYSVKVRHIIDESPDTSWLGEYSDHKTSPYSIDRNESGDMQRGQYRYFNPSFNYVDKNGEALPGNTPDEVRKYVAQDYDRMESLNSGYWCFMGIRAEAEVGVSLDGGQSFKLDTLTSGGLWGVESDSDNTYIKQEEENQLSELKDVLRAYGFGRTTITTAIKNAEVAED